MGCRNDYSRIGIVPVTGAQRFSVVVALAAMLGSCVQRPAPPVTSGQPTAVVPAPGVPAEVALVPFYDALDRMEAGVRRDPVVVLQIGDSHTANDGFSGRMRELLQARFGDAGRGFLPPGIPFKYYKPSDVVVVSKGWTVVSSFSPSSTGPFGITGLRQHAAGHAEMTLTGDRPGALDKASIEVLMQPDGGTIRVSFDTGAGLTISTAAPVQEAVEISLPSAGATSMTVKTLNRRPVDLLSWSVERQDRGVIYANLGTIGARIDLIGRWDSTIVAQELARLRPSLIEVAFGTNEGFNDTTNTGSYGELYASEIAMLHQAAPQAAFILIGPPDGVRKPRPGVIDGGGCGVYPSATGGEEEWVRPRNLERVREAQRKIAAEMGFYFWNWSEAMGGTCSMAAWASMNPPLSAPDHIHLFRAGYRITAERLFNSIMDGYDRYELSKRPR